MEQVGAKVTLGLRKVTSKARRRIVNISGTKKYDGPTQDAAFRLQNSGDNRGDSLHVGTGEVHFAELFKSEEGAELQRDSSLAERNSEL